MYTFLAQEASKRTSDQSVADSMVDTLILWALEGTDPDRNILRDRAEILRRAKEEIPAVEPLFEQRLTSRLKTMASKRYPGGRAIRWHRSEDGIAFRSRPTTELEDERMEDISMKLELSQVFEPGFGGPTYRPPCNPNA